MREPLPWSIALACVLLLLVARAWERSFRARRRMARAREGEASARGLLARRGFDVVAEQVAGSITLRVDGADSSHALRADYVVLRRGKRYVAEVKTGSLAPSLDHAPTRRQILEYCTAFDVDGALLVEPECDRVREIAVPRAQRSVWPWIALGMVTGGALVALWR